MIILIKLILDDYLNKKEISRYELAKRTGVQYQIVDNYYKNKIVRYDSYILNKFCETLGCDISDLVAYIKD